MGASAYGVSRYGTTRYAESVPGAIIPARIGPLAPPVYVIYVRDATRRRVAEVDQYTDAEFVLRDNAVGSWQLTLPADTLAAQLLLFGGGIIVSRNGRTILSGPVGSRERVWGLDTDHVVFRGPDDMTLLAEEPVSPDPTLSGPPYNTQAADVQAGAAETVIKHYVNANLGPGAVAAKRRGGLTLAVDQGRGTNPLTGRGRFQPVLTLLQELATTGALRFTLTQDVTTAGFPLIFECHTRRDRHTTAVFSAARGSLAAVNYKQAAPEATYIIVGGQGEGTARTFREGGDAAALTFLGRRVALFVDRRDTADTGELNQAIAENLTNRAPKTELQVTPLDSSVLTYQADYDLGDTVTVEVDGEPLVDTIRTLVIQLTTDRGETITPYVGSPQLADRKVNALFRRLLEQGKRLTNLERQ